MEGVAQQGGGGGLRPNNDQRIKTKMFSGLRLKNLNEMTAKTASNSGLLLKSRTTVQSRDYSSTGSNATRVCDRFCGQKL